MVPFEVVQENVYGAVPPAGVTVIPPSSAPKQLTSFLETVALSCVGCVTVAAAVDVHPASPVALLASVIEKV